MNMSFVRFFGCSRISIKKLVNLQNVLFNIILLYTSNFILEKTFRLTHLKYLLFYLKFCFKESV